MGSIGEYWREHKEYKRKKLTANVPIVEKKSLVKVIECDCGKWFGSDNSYKQHVRSFGRDGHQEKIKESDLL